MENPWIRRRSGELKTESVSVETSDIEPDDSKVNPKHTEFYLYHDHDLQKVIFPI